jgi:hypothetical protein
VAYLPGGRTEKTSAVTCANSAFTNEAMRGLSFGEAMGQSLQCNAVVLEDKTRSAKIETTCASGSSTMMLERVIENGQDDVVKIQMINNMGGGQTRSESTLKWLNRPCAVKASPQVNEQQCTEARVNISKMRAAQDKLPPGMAGQLIGQLESAMKAQGCSL